MEQKLEAFKGIKINSLRRELEIPDTTFLRTAKNVVIGNDGSLYAHTGNIIRSNPSATVHRVFYSAALNRYVSVNATSGDIKIYSIDTNGVWSVTTTHAAIAPETAAGAPFTAQLVDWPLTSTAYVASNVGTNLHRLTVAGTTYASVALDAAISPVACMCVHKDTLWLAKGNALFPSDDLTLECYYNHVSTCVQSLQTLLGPHF